MLIKINIILIIIFILWIFSGQYIFPAVIPYDSWRIIEVLLLIWLANQLLFMRQNIQLPLQHQWLIAMMLALMLYSSYCALQPKIAITDAVLQFLLCTSLYICTVQANLHPQFFLNASKIISLLPLFSLIFLPVSIVQQLQGNPIQWYGYFPNYRMLDDALLPCLFLVWFWQSTTTNKILQFSLTLVATLYNLSFLLNGARANLLAIFSTLLLLGLFYRQSFRVILPSIISTLAACSLYAILTTLQIENIGSPLIRTSSSGRIDLWIKSIQLWLDAPILGVGGGNFIFQQPYLFSAHPHNWILQWLAEWGMAGLIMTFFLIYIIKKIYDLHQQLPIFLIGFLISFLMNILFSGTLIYPLSQILNLWGLMLILNAMLQQSTPMIWTQKKPYLLALIILFSSITMITLHLEDLTAQHYWLPDCIYPPRFWLDATQLHLCGG
ncbi:MULTISPECIES: O-antigen ligase family protein [unclassified Acinetobacter]|uniref:O-antigen ligase family protein n=1 Tax=unclassified Acinetobacter TaxID=196816 RepID=UPI00293433D5|nr:MULTISPECIES: O-antigen ligase family protein [unclassified Acinetobacter]WOE31078.1 O-antigen ligase family protein [Acinetobacter sp. SAAs470]WOE39274.1 O-antigen ligase family protein [Acinetobacter sp. SAAs474]